MKLDWLGVIAIIIMIVGTYLVVQEGKTCKSPFKNIIDKELKDNKINYSSAILYVYDKEGLVVDSFDVYLDKDTLVKKIDKNLNIPNLNISLPQ